MNTNNKPQEPGGDSFELSLFETLLSYFRHWKWFLFSIAVFLSAGYLYIRLSTPEYKIQTELLIKDNKQTPGNQNDLLKDLGLFNSDKIIDNEVQILKSNTILQKVINDLKLQTSYYNTEGVRKHEIYGDLPFEVRLLRASASKAYHTELSVSLINAEEVSVNGKKFSVGTPIATDFGIVMITPNSTAPASYKRVILVRFFDDSDLLELYSEKITIEPVSKQATVLLISMQDAIPQRGEDFLNKLVDEYNQAALEDKNKVTSNTLSFINDRLEVISKDLSAVEKNVEQYKSTNSITDISSQSQIFLQSVKDNDADLNKVLIEIEVLNNLENSLSNNQNGYSKLPSMMDITDPTLLGLVSKLAEAQIKRQSLLQTIPETNPIISSLNDQILSLKQAINSSVQSLKKGLEITKEQLQSKNNQFEGTIKQVPSKERGLLDVMRQQDIKNALFTYLLQKHEETAMQLASGVADSRTIDVAKSTKYPVSPVKKLIYLWFFLAGVILPTAVIYVKGLLNFRVSRRSDVERATKAPIIGEISQSDETDPLLIVGKPRSMVAEQVRVLRTNLQFILPNKDQKTLLFTSSISGEGKSFLSLNLGASLAMSDKKVVILELDMRKPKLHVGLDINNKFGVSNYLVGNANYADILKEIPSLGNYYIITSGPIPPNPAELLSNGQINVLLEKLKTEFDYIIMDAPPVGLVTDAQILGDFADATIFVVRHNYTVKNHLESLEVLYQNKKFKNLNVVLNSVDPQIGYGYSHGYGYGYGGYGYGGGYYQDNLKASGMSSKFNRLFKGFGRKK